MFSLEERVVLLTGAGGHLGRAMALGILEAGGSLIMVGRSKNTLDQVRNTLPGPLACKCHIRTVDLAEEDAVDALIRSVETDFGRVHGLVNNAYLGKVGPLAAIDSSDFRDACALNLTAPFLLAKGLEPLLAAAAQEGKGASSIVNIASMYGKVSPDPSVYKTTGANNPVHYGATKAGMIQLTRYLACHLNPIMIRVNSISPGPFPDIGPKSASDDFSNELRRRVPMARLGLAKEIAGPVVFLLSTAASYINGADLAVDGGWTAW